jgi:queuosine precursor transporter
LLNVMGITRFIQLGPMALAVGVLPYPLTFLCTDLISELYGRSRANFVVSLGLALNIFIIGILSLGAAIPSVGPEAMPPWQLLQLEQAVSMPNGATIDGAVELYSLLLACTSGAVIASMLAYIAAQYCDVHLFHFFKKLTKGRHLWLRNNFSTLVSQGVDSVAVISVTFGAVWLAGNMPLTTLLALMGSNYLFKMAVALADTLPFYILTFRLKRFLQLD